jgi:hypothetical protein
VPPHGVTRAGIAHAAAVVLVMWAAGALLGMIWQWWSPAGPAGYVLGPGRVQPDETEAFVAGDGRYAALVVAAGIAFGALAWLSRMRRGVPAISALTLGGLGGALVTAVIGHTVRGAGRHYACGTGTCIDHLRLSVHAHGLVLIEAAAAVLVYGLVVAFTRSDDLGEPDPLRRWAQGSVGTDVELEHAGRHRDGVGGAQQGDFPPQQPGQ